MQFVTRNVAKEELNSTPATVARKVARKVTPHVRAFSLAHSSTHSHLNKSLHCFFKLDE